MAQIYTDAAFKCPAYRGLNAAIKAGNPAWTYLFNHTDSCTWSPGIPKTALRLLAATHTAEIPFVFGNTADLPLPNGTCNFTSSEAQISNSLVAAWSSMAESGQPSVQGNLQWPAYSPSSSQGIIINNSTAVIGHIDYSACELLDPLIEALVNAIPASNISITPTSSASASFRGFRLGGNNITATGALVRQ